MRAASRSVSDTCGAHTPRALIEHHATSSSVHNVNSSFFVSPAPSLSPSRPPAPALSARSVAESLAAPLCTSSVSGLAPWSAPPLPACCALRSGSAVVLSVWLLLLVVCCGCELLARLACEGGSSLSRSHPLNLILTATSSCAWPWARESAAHLYTPPFARSLCTADSCSHAQTPPRPRYHLRGYCYCRTWPCTTRLHPRHPQPLFPAAGPPQYLQGISRTIIHTQQRSG